MFVINATDYAPVTPVTPPCDIIPIFIGYKGENHARCLIFDLTDCIEEFGDGGFAISFMRHGDAQPYIVTDTDSLETTAIWEINATDTAVEGYGMVQLQYIVGETVCKSAMYRTVTFDSNESAGDVPDPYENLLDQIAAYAAAAQASASAAAKSSAKATAEANRIIANTAEVVGDWLNDNIGEISGYVIDKSLTVSDAAADAEVTGTWVRGSYITDTASGAVASFTDGADGVPVKDLKVSIVASQSGSGDPAPDNVRPITGWSVANVVMCGKNLYNSATVTANTYLKADGTTGSSTAFVLSDYIRCSEGIYSYSGCPNGFGTSPCTGFYDFNKEFISTVRITHLAGGQITVPSGAEYMRVSVSTLDKTTFQLEIGSDITSFEAYNGTTYIVSFGSAGTVYGGTLDVTTGVLTVTHYMDVLDETKTYGTSAGTAADSIIITYNNSTHSAPSHNESATIGCISSYLPETSAYTSWRVATPSIAFNSGGTNIWLRLPNVTTKAAGEAYLAANPLTVVYPLASPQTFALTPTQVTSLLGNNNIFADCGASDVTYRADPRLYLEKLTNPDSDMTADANIASGSYFMVGNRLYLATSAIALGASIVPGTNCTATDLASALNAINA